MPRKRKTLPMQAPGMEAGAAYGEQSHNLAAQNPAQGGIPLPDRSAPPEVSPHHLFRWNRPPLSFQM